MTYTGDPFFSRLHKPLKDGTTIPAIGGLKLELQEYFLQDGLLYKRNPTDSVYHSRLCIPNCDFKTHLLTQVHEQETCHLGRDRCAELLSRKFFWPKLNNDIRLFVSSCLVCQRSKPLNLNAIAPLTPLPVPSRPWQHVNMDFFALPDSQGFDRVLLVVDRFSKFIVLIPTVSKLDAPAAAKLFLDNVAYRFGFPDTVTGDRDVLWTSNFFSQVMSFFKIKLKLTTVARPQSDGQAERCIQSVKNLLRSLALSSSSTWMSYLKQVEFSLNSTINATTKFSPFYVNFLRHPRTVSDFIAGTIPDEPPITDLLSRMRYVHTQVYDNIVTANVYSATRYDRSKLPPEYVPGDLAYVSTNILITKEERERVKSANLSKLTSKYCGPFTVEKRISDSTYKLVFPPNLHAHPVVNVANMKPFVTTDRFNRTYAPPPLYRDEEGVFYEPLSIVSHRKRGPITEYRIRWKGYSPDEDTWEPASHLVACPLLLQDYYDNMS